MLPKRTRHLTYAVLLVVCSVLGTSGVAKYRPLEAHTPHLALSEAHSEPLAIAKSTSLAPTVGAILPPPVFSTIIANADEEVSCSNDGVTVARFNLCGNSDNRIIALNQSYGSYTWEQLVGCTYDVNEDCPAYSCPASAWQTVGTSATYTVNAGSISSTTGGEFRVRVDGGAYYFFKVKKSTITQTFVKRNFICGVPGRIQITNLSSAYEFSMDSGSGYGPWQGPIFDNLAPGTYQVKARLRDTPNTCEYPYDPITIEEREIAFDVSFVDAQCSGDTGSITVDVSNVPGPYKYTLLDETGTPQEFTSYIGSSSYSFNAVGFGTYSVSVETQQCTGDIALGIPPPTVDVDVNGNPIVIGNGLNALSASTEVNNSFGCSVASVDITVRTSGGAAPYTYTVNGGGASSPSYSDESTYTVNSPGTYDFLITDANGCTIVASADVEELTPPDVTVSGTDGTCTNGGARLDINVTNPKGYNLSFRATPSDPWSPNPQLGVPAGTYDEIQVRYQQGGFDCILDIPTAVTVNTTGTINGNAVKLADQSCDGAGGTTGGGIEFQGPFSGGSGSGYTFSISGDDPSNFSTQTTYTNLAPGTYTPIIRDGGGCRLELTPITIDPADPPRDIDFSMSNMSCVGGTADVSLNVTANAAISTYEIIAPSAVGNGGNNTFTGLAANTSYTFRVTDANGCTYEESFTPIISSSIRVRLSSNSDVKVCPTATDGTATFIVDGFNNNYTYNIDGGAESAPQSDRNVVVPALGAGTYTITITDADTGCTDTASVTIEEPATALGLNANVTDMSCANGNIGSVRANASGGFGGYRYTLTEPNGNVKGPKSGRNFGNLTQSGTYTLTVEDAEGCTESTTFDLTPLDSPTISLDTADYCYSATVDASVTVSSSGGGGNHQYRVNNGPLQASATFNGLVPGNYTIEVVDDNNCTDEVTVRIPPQVQVALSIVDEIPCGGTGLMEINVSGGNFSDLSATQYTVFKDGSPVTGFVNLPIPSDPFTYTVPLTGHGDYTVSVTDTNGCTNTSQPITFDQPTNITATHRIVGPSCGDPNSGFVEIIPDVTDGLPPFEIKFGPSGSLTYGLTDDGAYIFSSQTVYSGLPSGDYDYVVKDARGCLIPGITTVTVAPDTTLPPDAVVAPIDASCNASIVSGGVQISGISDGVAEYTYVIEDLFGNVITQVTTDSSTVYPLDILDNDITPGEYRVITVDARGCTDEDLVTVGSSTVDIVPNFTMVPNTCTPGGFAYEVEIVGGTGPFQIRLLEVPAASWESPNLSATRHEFTNVQHGEAYTVEVWDQGTNCYYTETIEIPDGPTLDVALSMDNATCNGGDVALTYTVTGSTGNLDITVRNLDTGAIVISETRSETTYTYNLPSGPYGVSVVDASGCADGDVIDVILDAPRVDVIENINANCNELGQLTVRGSGGTPYSTGSPYLYAYMEQGVPPTDSDFTDASTVTLAGAPAPGKPYDIWVKDARDCAYMITAAVIQEDLALPAPGFSVNNQCDVSAGSFNIDVYMPGYVDTPNFTLGGVSQFGTYNAGEDRWETTFVVGGIGVYRVDVMDANGCTSFAEPEVFQVLTASGGFGTDEPTCTNSDGTITVTADGGSGDFTFELQDSSGTPITSNATGQFTGIAPGEYRVLVTDNLVDDGTNNCTATVFPIISAPPVPPVILDLGKIDVSCNGADDGSILVELQGGSDSDGIKEYRLLDASAAVIDTNTSGSFSGLAQGNYTVEVETEKGCVDSDSITIIEPSAFAITASAPDFTCESGANRYSSTTITVSIADPGTPGNYRYSISGFENYQASNTFEIVDNGVNQDITVYAIDANGCQATFDLPTLTPPSEVNPVITQLTALNCAGPEQVEITVPETNDFTVNVVGATAGIGPFDSSGSNTVVLDLPAAGNYLFELQDNRTNGCLYPLPEYVVDAPIEPIATISEAQPVQCFGTDDGALFLDVTDYDGVYSYEVFAVDNNGNQSTIGVTGTFDTANFPDAAGDPARIGGLPGGNFVVSITSTEDPFCSTLSNVATIRTPNGPLVLTLEEVGNVSCTEDTGKIVANATGGWDNMPYEFSLHKDDGTGAFVEEVAYGPATEFEGISSGTYRVYVRDVEGCEVFEDIILDPIPPIVAGIREPSGLSCPDGNNAILEAFDPTTGDALTATAGASGGVPGAGYKYQLLYLNGNDNTDINSRGGLQETPTFSGDNSGVISAGWYAIEVLSSYGCIGVTDPYYVEPPPPIIPRLVQVQAPGCGGLGQMRLSIENPEIGFDYEYRSVAAAATDPFIPMGGTAVLIDGGPGFYQYDVRKIGAASICNSVKSPGITMVEAEDVDLIVNLPDDISCYSELDGRIESFADGGVGNYSYTLYYGNPGADPFNPNAGATVVAPAQDYGTFEGLDEGTEYYIAVTSGVSCGDIQGPFAIQRPAPIEYTATANPVSCNGDQDGSISITVDSGGVGLVQFALSPNFNEFFSDPDNPDTYTFTDLPQGTYEVLIQDEKGCYQKETLTIVEPDPLEATAVVTPEICINAADGTAQLTVTGGTPFVDAGSGADYFETKLVGPNSIGDEVYQRDDTLFFDNLAGGESYVVFIRDSQGCETYAVVTIDPGVDLTATPEIEYGCNGMFPFSTVTIAMQDTSLMSELRFALDVDDPTQATDQNVFGDLPAGDHIVYVYHNNGCMAQVPFSVTQYDPIAFSATTLDVSCNGAADGSITVQLDAGGIGLVQYAISPNLGDFYNDSNNPSTYTFTGLSAGTYEVLVEDEEGCYQRQEFTISEPDALTASFVATPEICVNAMDGTAQVTVSGGTPFVDTTTGATYYETQIIGNGFPAGGTYQRNDSLFYDNLVGGASYQVLIRDAQGCETTLDMPIPLGVDLTATPVVEYGCEGIFPNSTARVEMADSSVMPELLFALDVDDITQATDQYVFGDLPAGDHTVYIYHSNGCATFVEFAIEAYEPLTLDVQKTAPNEITATAQGGFGGYEFYFQGEAMGSQNVFTQNSDGNISVRVVDAQGCQVEFIVPFEFTGMLELPNFFTPDGDNMNDVWYPGNHEFFPNLEVKIYDRYGRVVAVLNKVEGWDGTYEGKAVPTGDYWYVVNSNDKNKQQWVGHFTLYR